MPERIQVYAIVRVDVGIVGDDAIAIKQVVPTLEEAEREVARLNELNADKQARYFWRATRYFPAGRTTAE